MIELLMLYSLTKSIGRIVRARGQKALPYQGLTVVLWFVGELSGAIIGTLVVTWLGLSSPLLVYLIGLFGAAVGAWSAHLIATHVQKPVKCPCCDADLGIGYNYPQCGHCGAALLQAGSLAEKPQGS